MKLVLNWEKSIGMEYHPAPGTPTLVVPSKRVFVSDPLPTNIILSVMLKAIWPGRRELGSVPAPTARKF